MRLEKNEKQWKGWRRTKLNRREQKRVKENDKEWEIMRNNEG